MKGTLPFTIVTKRQLSVNAVLEMWRTFMTYFKTSLKSIEKECNKRINGLPSRIGILSMVKR